MTSKVLIEQDETNPLWKECVRRFISEVKQPPDMEYKAYAPNYYYRTTRGKLNVDDYDWYLIDDVIITREKKIESY